MFDRFLKVSTANGEQRWINLDRVTRVSLATGDCGEPVLAFCFGDQDRVLIHGTDDLTRDLINNLTGSLDTMAHPSRAA